jgi:hypothetical protein
MFRGPPWTGVRQRVSRVGADGGRKQRARHIVGTFQASGKVYRRFVSANHLKKMEGSCTIGVGYEIVEAAVLSLLRELRPADLIPSQNVSGRKIELRRQKVQGIDERLKDLRKALKHGLDQAVEDLQTAIAELRTERETLLKEVDDLSVEQAVQEMNPLSEFPGVLGAIASAPKKQQRELRLRLQSLVCMMVEKVKLEPYRSTPRCSANVAVTLRNGQVRWRYDIASETPQRSMECSTRERRTAVASSCPPAKTASWP